MLWDYYGNIMCKWYFNVVICVSNLTANSIEINEICNVKWQFVDFPQKLADFFREIMYLLQFG